VRRGARKNLGDGQDHLIDQRRITRVCLRAIDALRHRPRLQVVVRRRLQIFGARLAAQPRYELLLGQKHWHAVVHFGGEGVGLANKSSRMTSAAHRRLAIGTNRERALELKSIGSAEKKYLPFGIANVTYASRKAGARRKDLTYDCDSDGMWKTIAVAVVALLLFDHFYLNGQYTRAVMAILSH
jgi:hypothetical protein